MLFLTIALGIAGSHNDARMCLSIAITAARLGATIANHVRVTGLIKSDAGRVIGAEMKDEITGETWKTFAKTVINATGEFLHHNEGFRELTYRVCRTVYGLSKKDG